MIPTSLSPTDAGGDDADMRIVIIPSQSDGNGNRVAPDDMADQRNNFSHGIDGLQRRHQRCEIHFIVTQGICAFEDRVQRVGFDDTLLE